MKKTNDQKISTMQRVAVPYYGALVHPQTGLSNLFFLADVDQASGSDTELKLTVWDAQRYPRLADWFKTEKVSGLLCREENNPHLQELKDEGFWVDGGQKGEAEEMFAQWRGTAATHLKLQSNLQVA